MPRLPRPTGRQLRIGAASAALVGLSAVSLVNLASSALLTDTRTAGPATVTSGNVSLALGSSTFSGLAASASAPGDATYTLLSVANSGSLQMRYAATLTWSTSNALTRALQFGVIKVATSSSTCDGTLSWANAVDHTTYLAKDVTATGTSVALFGDPAPGADPGDRTLAASGVEYLCVRAVVVLHEHRRVLEPLAHVRRRADRQQRLIMTMTASTPRSRTTAARLATVVAAGLLVVAASHEGGPLPSLAVLQDSQTTGTATVTSGNIELTLSDGAAAGQWTGDFTMVPGAASQYFPITVTNTGTAALVYAVRATSTTATLASHLTVSIAQLASSTTACTSSSYASGTVVSNSGTLAFGTTSGLDIIGDPTTGIQTGDRTLVGSGVDNLCLKVDFPLGTGMGFAGRGATATTTFSFSAESA